MMNNEIKDLCDRIRQMAYDIHVYHGHGHLEKVYENALGHRLRKAGLKALQKAPFLCDLCDLCGQLSRTSPVVRIASCVDFKSARNREP